ncbi:MAG: cytochrome oxidase [Gemmatimonas sp.]|nr:cytochrome oxidase [Gemmatimonas sp.]
MDVLMITVFVSLLLVVGGLVLFFVRQRAGDFDHGDRLSLLPLADDPQGDPEPEAKTQEP